MKKNYHLSLLPFFHVPSLVGIAIDHFSEAESQQIHLHLPKTELQL